MQEPNQDSTPTSTEKEQPAPYAAHPHVSAIETQAADRLVQRAVDAARSNNRVEAIALLDRALRLDGTHLEALLWRGGLSEPEQALPYLERAFALAPHDARSQEGLAWTRRQLGLPAQPASDATAQPVVTVQEPVQPVPVEIIDTTTEFSVLPSRRRSLGVALARVTSFLTRCIAFGLVLLVLLLGALAVASYVGGGENAGAAAVLPDPVSTLVASVLSTPTPTATATAAATATATVTPTASPTLAPTATATPAAGQLDSAWSAQDWPAVIAIVENMVKAAPADAALKEKLFSAHVNYAVALVRGDKLAEAIAEFDRALAILPGDKRATGEREFAKLYLDGSTALNAGNFEAAIKALKTIYDGNPSYRSAKARLYQAYIGQATALEANGKTGDAYQSFAKALEIDSKGAEAVAGTTRLKASAPTPAPAAAGKKIEVSIGKQQVTVWQNDQVVYRFKASTGKAPYLTRTGNFTILSKMPNAYSSAMQWGMPWWMGIYYAGKWENGFHAMARVGKNQVAMSESYLGKPATHGCIMLSDKDAKTLYDWAVIGAAVWIHQ